MTNTNQIIRCSICNRYKKHGVWADIPKDIEHLMLAQQMPVIEIKCDECIQGKYKPITLWNLDKCVSKVEEKVDNLFYKHKLIIICIILIIIWCTVDYTLNL